MTVYIGLAMILITMFGVLIIAWHQEYGGKHQRKHPREKNSSC